MESPESQRLTVGSVAGQMTKMKGLINHSLPREGSVSVQQHAHHLLTIRVSHVELLCPNPALHLYEEG